jgi:hypothetical protein
MGAVFAGTLLVLSGGEARPRASRPGVAPELIAQRGVDPNVQVIGGVARQSALPVLTPTPTVEGPASADLAAVWSNGDSTSYFMSVWLLGHLVERGATQTQPVAEYHQSSGLSNPWFFDWYAYFASEMAVRQPNLVVFMIGANDAAAAVDLTHYRQLVAQAMDQLRAPGRRVIWVGQPAMGRADLAPRMQPINDVFRSEAALRPWVTFVDVYPLSVDSSGNYVQFWPNEFGHLVQARADDGVHFTSEGGRLLALEVLRHIEVALGWPLAGGR